MKAKFNDGTIGTIKATFRNGATGVIETSGVATSAYAVFFNKPGDKEDDWHRREFLNHADLDKFLAKMKWDDILGVFVLENGKAAELLFCIQDRKTVCEQVLSVEDQPISILNQFKRDPKTEFPILIRQKGSLERVGLKWAAIKAVFNLFNRYNERKMAQDYDIFIESKNSDINQFSYLVIESQSSRLNNVFLFNPDKYDLDFVAVREAIERIARKKLVLREKWTILLDDGKNQAVICHELNDAVSMKIEETPKRSWRY